MIQLQLFYLNIEYRKDMKEDFYFHTIQWFPKHLDIEPLIYYNGSGKYKDEYNRNIHDTICDETIERIINFLD